MTTSSDTEKEEREAYPVMATCYWCNKFIEHPFFMVGTPVGKVGPRYWFCSRECKDAYAD